MRQGVPVARVVELRLGSSRALMSQMRVLRWIRPPSVALLTVARLLSAIHGRLLYVKRRTLSLLTTVGSCSVPSRHP